MKSADYLNILNHQAFCHQQIFFPFPDGMDMLQDDNATIHRAQTAKA